MLAQPVKTAVAIKEVELDTVVRAVPKLEGCCQEGQGRR